MTTEIEQYVACIYEPGDWIELRALQQGKAQKSWTPAGAMVQQIDHLQKLNGDGWNIYVGPNPRREKGQSGDDSVKLCRCLFADFDDLPGSAVIKPADIVLAQIEEKGLPRPTMLINSGHGVHAYELKHSYPLFRLATSFWRLVCLNLNLG